MSRTVPMRGWRQRLGWLALAGVGRWLRRGDWPAWRRRQARLARWTPSPPGVRFVPWQAGPLRGEWVVPPAAEAGAVLYLHGGGFVLGSARNARALTAPLAALTRRRVLALDYRLAPEHPFPAALEDAVAAVRWLAAEGTAPLWLAGDSAGGGLAVTALVRCRDLGLPRSAGAVLFSPWVDLTLSGASVHARAARDPLLTPDFLETCARLYAGATPREHPLVSPLFADLRDLPPLLVHVGTEEVLFDDAVRLAARAQEAGVSVRLRIWPGMPHVFPLFGFLPAARQAMAESAAFVRETAPS